MSSWGIMPGSGCWVVNGYAATWAPEPVSTACSEDLPTFGGPMRASWAAPSGRTTKDGPPRPPPFRGRSSSSESSLIRRLMSPWRWSVPLCFGMTRSISRRRSRRSTGSRAWRNAASAARYSGVRFAGMTVSSPRRPECTPLASLPHAPDFLGRPAVRPLGRHVGFSRRGVSRGANLDQVEHLESVGAKEADPLSDRQREFHRVLVGPLEPVQAEVVPHQAVGRGIFAVGGAQVEEDAVLEEDELAPRAQEAGGLGNPAVRVAPDAGAVFGQGQIEAGIRQRDGLGVSVDQRKVEPVLALERAGGLELLEGIVDADDAGAAPGEPRRPVGGAAAKLDHILACDLGQGAEVTLGHAPDAPGRLGARPGPAARLSVLRGKPVPVRAVAPDVLRKRGVAHALSGGEDGGFTGAVEEEDLVGLGCLTRRVHAGRAGGHAGHGQTRRARALLQQAVDEVGRYVALDDVALDQGGVTGSQALGDLMALLDRRDVGNILFLDRIAAGAQVTHPPLAATSGRLLVHGHRGLARSLGRQSHQADQPDSEEAPPRDAATHRREDTRSLSRGRGDVRLRH